MKKLFANAAMALVGVLTTVNAVAYATSRLPIQPSDMHAMVGKRIGTLVSAEGDSKSVALSAWAPGRCVLAIVSSPTCGAGASALREWHASATRSTHTGTLAPALWSVVWVSTEDAKGSAGMFPGDFAWKRLYTSPGAFKNETGLPYFPAFFVLNKSGVVIYEDVGAPLPRYEQLRPDCTIQDVMVATSRNGKPQTGPTE